MSRVPTPAQTGILRLASREDGPHGGGFGPLGADRRPYDACLRRGWTEEVAVERGFGLGPGVICRITPAGRDALASVAVRQGEG